MYMEGMGTLAIDVKIYRRYHCSIKKCTYSTHMLKSPEKDLVRRVVSKLIAHHLCRLESTSSFQSIPSDTIASRLSTITWW